MRPPPPDPNQLRSFLPWLDKLEGLRIGVLGDFAIDHYLVGKTSRISREAPVMILKKYEDSIRPGQAGNSAANLAALGVKCFAFGVVGRDREGERLIRALGEIGINTTGIIASTEGRSIVKTRILAGAHHTALQQVIRLDDDEGLKIGRADRKRLSAKLRAALPKLDALLVSDYGYGTVNLALWNECGPRRVRTRGKTGTLRVLDSRRDLLRFTAADIITPNETEVFAHLGIEEFAGADPVASGHELMKKASCANLVMTRGNEGMFVFRSHGEPEEIGIFGSKEVTDVTGAGDTVAAVVTAICAAGADIIPAAHLANVAAGLKVMKRGAATVTPDEIRAAILRPPR